MDPRARNTPQRAGRLGLQRFASTQPIATSLAPTLRCQRVLEGHSPRACGDCRLVLEAGERCVICGGTTYAIADRPAEIFRPVEEVQLALRPEPRGWRKAVYTLGI